MKNILNKLNKIQVELKAPKGQYNNFGKYNFRSTEDIVEGLKPLLQKYKCALVIKDEITQIGDRYYIKATATLYDVDSGESISTDGYARESNIKKGMDDSQVTGSTSSYARKYALNGLLAIDDTKDSDTTNIGNAQPAQKQQKPANGNNNQKPASNCNGLISTDQIKRMFAIAKNDQLVKNIIEMYGYEFTKDIKIADYNAIVAEIENRVGNAQ